MTSPRRSTSSTRPSESPTPDPSPTFSSPSSSPSPEPMEPPKSTFLFQEPSASDPSPLEDPQSAPLDESPLSDPGDDSGSATRSILGKSPRKLRRDFLPHVKTAVSAIGQVLHQVLTAEDSLERDALLYVPDEDDVQAISEPIAGLASRRLPEGAGDPDAADLIALAIGLGGYVVKQLTLRAQIKAHKKQLSRPVEVDHTPPEPEPTLGDAIAPDTVPVGV